MLNEVRLPTKSQLYDDLYAAGDDIIKRENPCQIHTNADGTVSCIRTRKGGPDNTWPGHEKALCCAGCRHHSPSGCTIQALSCKLHACSNETISAHLAGWPQHVITDLATLRKSARRGGINLSTLRATKSQTLSESLIGG